MDLDEDLDGVLDAQMQWAVEKMIVTKLEQEQDRPHLISLPTSIDTPAAPRTVAGGAAFCVGLATIHALKV